MAADTNIVAAVVGAGMVGGFSLLGWLTKTLIGGIREDIAGLATRVEALFAADTTLDRRLTRMEADRDLESVMARTGRRRRSDERTV